MARKKPLVLPPSEAQATQVTRGYKYRIYPNQQQQAYLAKAFGSARFVYNRLLEHTSKAYQDYQSGLSTTKPSIRIVLESIVAGIKALSIPVDFSSITCQ